MLYPVGIKIVSNDNDAPEPVGTALERVPKLATFLNALNTEGIDSARVQDMVRRMSYIQVAALCEHPDFQRFLNGVALKAFLSKRELPKSQMHLLKFLRDGSEVHRPRHAGGRKPKSLDELDDMSAPVRNGHAIDVTPRPADA